MDFKVNDKVLFGRSRGEQTHGTVLGIGRTGKLKVRQDEARGTRPVGTVWTVPQSLCRPAGSDAPPAQRPKGHLLVGQTVEYQDFVWEKGGLGTVLGVVTHVTLNGAEVFGNGRTIVLQRDSVKGVDRRPLDAVKDEAACVYGHLSPECLSCDGERPRAQVEVRRGQLHRALRALFIEAGREITESEAFGLTPYPGEKCPVSYHAQAAGRPVRPDEPGFRRPHLDFAAPAHPNSPIEPASAVAATSIATRDPSPKP